VRADPGFLVFHIAWNTPFSGTIGKSTPAVLALPRLLACAK
jgi:hypothetical protein